MHTCYFSHYFFSISFPSHAILCGIEMLGSPNIFISHISAIYVHFLSRQIIQAYGYKYYLYANGSQEYILSPLKKKI